MTSPSDARLAETITLEELIRHYGNQLASDFGQETVDRLEELQQARARIDMLEERVADLRREIAQAAKDAREEARDAYSEGRWDEREESSNVW